MKKILFSPIGGTDPVTNFRDGAMLHILRVYKPDLVVLYLSKEMVRFHEKDNRYLYTIKKLEEKLNHRFEVCLILKEELTEVQKFDYFYLEFRTLLEELKNEKDAEILLNISSGTPAMKGALSTLSVLSEFNEKAIQVTTPEKKLNIIHEDREDYDVEFLWESNEDNQDNFENRCSEERGIYLLTELRKGIIRKHIDAFDYHAAMLILKEIPAEQISERASMMIHAAYFRTNLDMREFDKLSGLFQDDVVPIKEGNKRPLFEFVAVLRLKLLTGEYADFVRAISPAISELIFMSIKNHAKLDLKDYVTKAQGGYYWKSSELNKNKELLQLLEEISGDKIKKIVTTHQLIKLLESYCKNEVVMKLAKDIRDIEINVRNIAAHTIVSIDEQFIEQRTGTSPEKIMKLILSLMQANQVDVSDGRIEIYEKMNQDIAKEL